MFFLEDLKNITKEDELYKYIIRTKNNLQKIIEIQYAKKSMLTQIIDKIANADVNQIEISNTQNLLFIIEETKETLDRVNDNLSGLNELLDEINEIINKINESIDNKVYNDSLSKDIEYFFVIYNEKINVISEINLVYERIILNVYRYILSETKNAEDTKQLYGNNEMEEKNAVTAEENSKSNDKTKYKEIKDIKEEVKDEKDETKELLEDNNVLKISEIDKKVYLPYKVSDLKRILNDNLDEYKTLAEIVDAEYIVPLDKYKNSAFSRFKEAYNLMRIKERASFSESIDLALEVTFKNELNPTIISACRDLEELDIYLNCLEENRIDEFKVFKVEHEGLLDIKR